MAERELQTNRIYSLIVGSSEDGWEITDLHITFDVSKMADNSKQDNTCNIEIYNLSREKQAYLEKEYIYAVLSVGYVGTGLIRLYAGQVVSASTLKRGADTITTIRMGSSYTELNHQVMNKIIPEGGLVEDVILEISKSLGTSRNVITGVNCKNPVLDGYPLSGTPKEMLKEVCKAHDMEWSIDDSVLYVRDSTTSHTKAGAVVVISQESGLIERPYLTTTSGGISKKNDKIKKKGLQFKCLINPELIPGSLIKLEYGEVSGYYRIDSLRATGGWADTAWHMDVKLTEKIG